MVGAVPPGAACWALATSFPPFTPAAPRTCAPRGPATVTTLRATRSPAANSTAAAIFPLAAGTCHLASAQALRLTQRGAARSRRKASIGSASRGERVSPSYWVVLLALHWLRRQNLFIPLAASANLTIFPIYWLLVGVKVLLSLDPLTSFAMSQFLTTLKEKRDLQVGFPSNWLRYTPQPHLGCSA